MNKWDKFIAWCKKTIVLLLNWKAQIIKWLTTFSCNWVSKNKLSCEEVDQLKSAIEYHKRSDCQKLARH